MAPPPDIHPQFGNLICRRRGRVMSWILAILLLPLGLGASAVAVVAVVVELTSSPPTRTVGGFVMAFFFGGIGGILLSAGLMCLQPAAARIWFYEHGALRRRWGRETAIPYDRAVSLEYEELRRVAHGMYAGTSVELVIRSDDGRSIRFAGMHKERCTSGIIVLNRTFEGTDEIESVRDTIAAFIADRMQRQVLDGHQVDWCGRASLGTAGITPLRGRLKRQVLPWAEIEMRTTDDDEFGLHLRGERKSFLVVPPTKVNFWPGLELALRFMHTAAPPALEQPAGITEPAT